MEHHSSDPPFLRGGVNFKYSTWMGLSEKLKKGVEVWYRDRSSVFLKGKGGVGWGAGTFLIKYFQSLSFLHSEITLPFAKLCLCI